MVKTACVLWPVRARLDLAARLDKLATEIRQDALTDMGQPFQARAQQQRPPPEPDPREEHGPNVYTTEGSERR